jgi:hypothetical protein
MRTFFLFCFLFISGGLLAQSDRFHVHLRSGASIPLFEYASPDLDNGCFTKTGFSASVAASGTLIGSWGLVAEAGFHTHHLDVSYLGYEKVQADPFLLDVTIRSEPYRILTFTGGPMYHVEPFEGFHLQLAVLAGYFASRTPHQVYKPVYFLTGPEFYEITTSLDRSFGYGTSASLSYEITPCYELALDAELLRSKAEFQFLTGTGTIRTDTRQISMVNIALSLMLKLPSWHTNSAQ